MTTTSEYIITESSTREAVTNAHAEGMEILDGETMRSLTCLVCPSCGAWVGDSRISKDISEYARDVSVDFYAYDCVRCSTCESCNPDCKVSDARGHTICIHDKRQCRCSLCRQKMPHIHKLRSYLQTHDRFQKQLKIFSDLDIPSRRLLELSRPLTSPTIVEIECLASQRNVLAPILDAQNAATRSSRGLNIGSTAQEIAHSLANGHSKVVFAASMYANHADISRRLAGVNRSLWNSPTALEQLASVSQITKEHRRLSARLNFGQGIVTPSFMRGFADTALQAMTHGLANEQIKLASAASMYANQDILSRRLSEVSGGVLGQLASMSHISDNHMRLSGLIDHRQGEITRHLSQVVGYDFARLTPLELTGRISDVKSNGKVVDKSFDSQSVYVPSSENDSYREQLRRYVEQRTPAWVEVDADAISKDAVRELRSDLSSVEFQLIHSLQQIPLSERIQYIQKMYLSCVAKVESLFQSLLKHKGSAAKFGRGVNRIVQLLRTGTLLEWLWEKIMWLMGFM